MFTVFKTIKLEYNSFSNYYKLLFQFLFIKEQLLYKIRFGDLEGLQICCGQQVCIILHTANRLLLFKMKERLF